MATEDELTLWVGQYLAARGIFTSVLSPAFRRAFQASPEPRLCLAAVPEMVAKGEIEAALGVLLSDDVAAVAQKTTLFNLVVGQLRSKAALYYLQRSPPLAAEFVSCVHRLFYHDDAESPLRAKLLSVINGGHLNQDRLEELQQNQLEFRVLLTRVRTLILEMQKRFEPCVIQQIAARFPAEPDETPRMLARNLVNKHPHTATVLPETTKRRRTEPVIATAAVVTDTAPAMQPPKQVSAQPQQIPPQQQQKPAPPLQSQLLRQQQQQQTKQAQLHLRKAAAATAPQQPPAVTVQHPPPQPTQLAAQPPAQPAQPAQIVSVTKQPVVSQVSTVPSPQGRTAKEQADAAVRAAAAAEAAVAAFAIANAAALPKLLSGALSSAADAAKRTTYETPIVIDDSQPERSPQQQKTPRRDRK
eukprot:TRINITY_DN2317_c0_g1_i1.p1 TRINITY_DN2317_c0_g1~~TRINITY_DN2317_c0_g1_i1.p1  ORF type:complete len:423 (+),score=112.36 TRINITY_DN2317_c0_g1_i1:25-1269(+)